MTSQKQIFFTTYKPIALYLLHFQMTDQQQIFQACLTQGTKQETASKTVAINKFL